MNTVGVVGLGYVGLTLAVALARKGFTVHGVDTVTARPRRAHARAGRISSSPGVEDGLRACLGHRHPRRPPRCPQAGVDAAVICVSTPGQ